MGAGEARIENFARTFGKLRGHVQEQEWPLTVDQEFEAVNDCGLDGIKKNKVPENFSPFRYNPAENNEKDQCKMASEIGDPGQNKVKGGGTPPSIRPFHQF